MTDTIVEIVASGKHIVLESKQSLRCHQRCGQITGCLTLPVRINLLHFLYGFGRNVERISLTGGKSLVLSLDPITGILREKLTTAGSNTVAANDQLVRPDHDGNIFQNVGKCRRTAFDDRQSLRLLIGLRQQNSTVRFDFRHTGIQMINQLGNTGAFLNPVQQIFLIIHSFFSSLSISALRYRIITAVSTTPHAAQRSHCWNEATPDLSHNYRRPLLQR